MINPDGSVSGAMCASALAVFDMFGATLDLIARHYEQGTDVEIIMRHVRETRDEIGQLIMTQSLIAAAEEMGIDITVLSAEEAQEGQKDDVPAEMSDTDFMELLRSLTKE